MSRQSTPSVTSKEVAGYALFVVILEEIEHVVTYIVSGLPLLGNVGGRATIADDVAHAVIHANLVVKIVKTCGNIVAVLCRIIDFSDECLVGVKELHLVCGPCPEGSRHHLRHVAAESINTLGSPEEQNIGHLVPSIRNRIEVFAPSASIAVVDAIVQLYGFIPVVAVGTA